MAPPATQPTLIDDAQTGVKDVQLVPASPMPQPGDSLVLMFERLAKDKDVDVEKLQKLIELQERILKHNAKAAFDAAFALMQPDIPEIDEKGQIKGRDGTVQSTYARNEDMQKVLKPILAKHGFSLSFRTEWPDKDVVRIVGILSHRDGHSRESEFRSAADSSGNKNAIQALGSTVAYGHRYSTKDLLNVTSRLNGERDDDGQTADKFQAPDAPEGYDAWIGVLDGVASEGWPKLSAAWGAKSPRSDVFRQYATRHDKARWNAIRAKAEQVKA